MAEILTADGLWTQAIFSNEDAEALLSDEKIVTIENKAKQSRGLERAM